MGRGVGWAPGSTLWRIIAFIPQPAYDGRPFDIPYVWASASEISKCLQVLKYRVIIHEGMWGEAYASEAYMLDHGVVLKKALAGKANSLSENTYRRVQDAASRALIL